LVKFRQALTPYANTKAVRDFDDKHSDNKYRDLVIVSQH
jgi:hypothetical protein